MPSAISSKLQAAAASSPSDSSVKLQKKEEQGLSTKSTLSSQNNSVSAKPSKLRSLCKAIKSFCATIYYYITFQWLCKKSQKQEQKKNAPASADKPKIEEQKKAQDPSDIKKGTEPSKKVEDKAPIPEVPASKKIVVSKPVSGSSASAAPNPLATLSDLTPITLERTGSDASTSSNAEHMKIERESEAFLKSLMGKAGQLRPEDKAAIHKHLISIQNANYRYTAFKFISGELIASASRNLSDVQRALLPSLRKMTPSNLSSYQTDIDNLNKASVELLRTVSFLCWLSGETIPHKMENALDKDLSRFDEKYHQLWVDHNGFKYRPHEAILIDAAKPVQVASKLFEAMDKQYPLLKETAFNHTMNLMMKRAEDFEDLLQYPTLILESQRDENCQHLDSWDHFDRLRLPSQKLEKKTPKSLTAS